jgi:tetratricopeptide (TPR) repeat protein
VKAFPSDGAGFNNLAFAYFQMRDFAKAAENAARAVALTPKYTLRVSNAMLFTLYAGDFGGAEQKARALLEITPGYPRGLVTLGLSRLARDQFSEAEAAYEELRKQAGAGANDGVLALGDLYMYRGRLADAATLVETSAANLPAGAGRVPFQMLLAEVRMAQGRGADAIKLAEAAVAESRQSSVRYRAARVLAQSQRQAQALAVAKPLVDAVDAESRALGALATGEALLAGGKARDALLSFQEAQKLADTWLGRVAMARAYLELKMFAEAGSELDRAWTRRGEATAVFMDDIPSWRVTAPLHYYQGLARAGSGNTAGAAEAFKTFTAIKAGGDEKSAELADAAKRLSPR